MDRPRFTTTGYYVYYRGKRSPSPVEGWTEDGQPLVPNYGEGCLEVADSLAKLGMGTCGRVLGVISAEGWIARYSPTGKVNDPDGVIVLPVISWIITGEQTAVPVTADWPDDLGIEDADYALIDLVPPDGVQAPHLVKPDPTPAGEIRPDDV